MGILNNDILWDDCGLHLATQIGGYTRNCIFSSGLSRVLVDWLMSIRGAQVLLLGLEGLGMGRKGRDSNF